MATPITWRNVNSDSNSAANALLAQAGQTLTNALGSFGKVATGLQQDAIGRQEDLVKKNTNDFLNTVSRYTTPEELQRAQAEGVFRNMLAGYGQDIDQAAVRNVIPDAMKALQSRYLADTQYQDTLRTQKEAPIKDRIEAAIASKDYGTYQKLMDEHDLLGEGALAQSYNAQVIVDKDRERKSFEQERADRVFNSDQDWKNTQRTWEKRNQGITDYKNKVYMDAEKGKPIVDQIGSLFVEGNFDEANRLLDEHVLLNETALRQFGQQAQTANEDRQRKKAEYDEAVARKAALKELPTTVTGYYDEFEGSGKQYTQDVASLAESLNIPVIKGVPQLKAGSITPEQVTAFEQGLAEIKAPLNESELVRKLQKDLYNNPYIDPAQVTEATARLSSLINPTAASSDKAAYDQKLKVLEQSYSTPPKYNIFNEANQDFDGLAAASEIVANKAFSTNFESMDGDEKETVKQKLAQYMTSGKDVSVKVDGETQKVRLTPALVSLALGATEKTWTEIDKDFEENLENILKNVDLSKQYSEHLSYTNTSKQLAAELENKVKRDSAGYFGKNVEASVTNNLAVIKDTLRKAEEEVAAKEKATQEVQSSQKAQSRLEPAEPLYTGEELKVQKDAWKYIQEQEQKSFIAGSKAYHTMLRELEAQGIRLGKREDVLPPPGANKRKYGGRGVQ